MSVTIMICIAIAATVYGFMSSLKFYESEYPPYSFWGRESYKRKYKKHESSNDQIYLTLAPKEKGFWGWYYKFFKIKYREAFPFSATILVFVTDGYHMLQFIMIKAILIAASRNVIDFFVLWAIWFLFFNVFFRNRFKG